MLSLSSLYASSCYTYIIFVYGWVYAARFLNKYAVPKRLIGVYSTNNCGICVIDIRYIIKCNFNKLLKKKFMTETTCFFFAEKDNMLINSCFIKVMSSNEKIIESRLISKF